MSSKPSFRNFEMSQTCEISRGVFCQNLFSCEISMRIGLYNYIKIKRYILFCQTTANKKMVVQQSFLFPIKTRRLWNIKAADFLHPIANSIKTTPQLHLNSTFVVYHKGVPGRRGHHRSGKQPRQKTTLGGTQVNPLVLRKGNEVAQT